MHISPKEVNVALVPADTASKNRLDEVIANTQAIYDKVGIKVNFRKENILNIDSVVSGNTIQTEKNTLTSTYSTEQQKINALYQSTASSYVLFVTEKASSTGQQGYMRLNGQFGYVFKSGLDKTPAHELGHGIFKLVHPFETYKTAESSTDLLMDYSEGTVLNHQDWKQINDPAFKLYSFQGQSSGELAGGYALAPDWSFVSNGDETTVAYLAMATKAFLGGLVKGDKKYKCSTNKYVCDEDATLKIETIASIADGSKIYLFFDNDKPIKQNKYLRTVYNKELKDIISTKNPDLKALSSYIDKYATPANFRQKDEKRTLYWGYVGCSNCDSDGVENGAVSV